MLNMLDVTNEADATLSLPLEDIGNGYRIKSIDGLDPVKATIVTSSFANMDGDKYQASRREKRNIVIKLGFDTSMDVRSLRNNLYPFFMTKTNLRLRFYSDEADMFYVEIYGRVESFESPIFAKDPEATISIVCAKPDFYEPEPVAWHGDTTSGSTRMPITYSGTIETGIRFSMNVNRTLPSLVIHHSTTASGTENDLTFAAPLISGDVLEIRTVPGDKGATLTRSGITSSILYGINPASIWTTLLSGQNYIRVSSGGAPISYTVEYTNKYGGL
jgi:hypothetical protein